MSEEINLDLTYTEVMKLIYAFKRHPVLWDTKNVRYRTKCDREDAWNLVAIQTGIQKAVCRNKMKSLLSTVRKERMKILKAKDEGRIELPKWRYWNDFKFLRGVEDDQDDPLGTAPEMDILDPKTAPEWLKAQVAGKRKATSIDSAVNQNEEDNIRNNVQGNMEDTFGATVATKLRKMYQDQRLYAENLINQILYRGLMEKLTKECEIETPDLGEFSKIASNSMPPADVADSSSSSVYPVQPCSTPITTNSIVNNYSGVSINSGTDNIENIELIFIDQTTS